jgi:DNA-binding NarL/FixJ family response regulator
MIKVVLVDDQLIYREGIKIILEQDKEIEVVGYAHNGKAALEVCERLSPDVVLMDVVMPEYDGVEGTRLIKEKFRETKVVMLTTFGDEEKVLNALNYGADGFIWKDVKAEDLILTVKSAAVGLSIIPMDTYKNLVRKVNLQNKISIIENKDLNIELTNRELSIIKLIVDGKSNVEIAETIRLTEEIVRNTVSGILKKLNLEDRTQLGVFAVKNDLV